MSDEQTPEYDHEEYVRYRKCQEILAADLLGGDWRAVQQHEGVTDEDYAAFVAEEHPTREDGQYYLLGDDLFSPSGKRVTHLHSTFQYLHEEVPPYRAEQIGYALIYYVAAFCGEVNLDEVTPHLNFFPPGVTLNVPEFGEAMDLWHRTIQDVSDEDATAWDAMVASAVDFTPPDPS